MATVGNHQQGAFSTPINGATADASVVLANDNANRTTTNAHDADATIHVQSSLLASRPAAGTAQRVWISTDGKRAYLDSGSVWDELDYLSKTAGGTVAGAVTLSAGLTLSGVTSGTIAVVISGGNGSTRDIHMSGQAQLRVMNGANSSANLTIDDTGTVGMRNTVTVSSGGIAVTGNSTITGTLSGVSTLTATAFVGTLSTAAQPNITSVGVLASTHLTSPVVDSGGVTVTAGNVVVSSGRVQASANGMFGAWDGIGDSGSLIVANNVAGTASTGAATLPVAPVGFLLWKLGATTIKVPYYAN